ncbi:MAG: methyltransferase domain-containing protein [Hyphomicrobiales bacterium]|nr:methyltransferase domain-containing protein [Hyphomicrobiales bacterium]
MSFSPDWLALREGADHRSRDALLAMKVADRLQGADPVRVTDLGCGTGSNIRASYALLGPRQHWTLVDYDPKLLAVARTRLAAWADKAETHADHLALEKSGKSLIVRFREADLTRDLDFAIGDAPHLVTAQALFDLCSKSFIETFAAAVAARKAVFYTVLTYNGVQSWKPEHAKDTAMAEAFHAHQVRDKGFGASAGPLAPAVLGGAFRAAGYHVAEGDSPWLLGRLDQALVDALAQGFADAVAETGAIDAASIAEWRTIARTFAEVGHTDTFAWPAD